jgi:hypothetical protein
MATCQEGPISVKFVIAVIGSRMQGPCNYRTSLSALFRCVTLTHISDVFRKKISTLKERRSQIDTNRSNDLRISVALILGISGFRKCNENGSCRGKFTKPRTK